MPLKSCSRMRNNMRLKALATLLFVLACVPAAGAPGGIARAQRKRAPAAANDNSSQASKSSGQKRHVFVGHGADTAQGSRVTIKSDNPLNDYSAYRSGDRFYVVLPRADASAIARGGGGKGYSDMQVQQRGSDVVLSYRVQPGAKPRVEQKFNRLDVVFDAPGGAQGNNGANRAATNATENRNANASEHPAGQTTSTQQNPNTAAGERRTTTQAANPGQAQAGNAGQAGAVAPPTATGEQPSGVEQPASNPPPAAEQTPAASPAGEQQVAEAQPPASVAPITDTTAGARPGTSLGTFLLRNWALALIIAFAIAGFGLILAARRASAPSSAALEEADEATKRALGEARASHLKAAPAGAELRAADATGPASKTTASPLVAASALAGGAAVEETEKSEAAVEETKKSKEEEQRADELAVEEHSVAAPSVAAPSVAGPVAEQASVEGTVVEPAEGTAFEEVAAGSAPASVEAGEKPEPEATTEAVAGVAAEAEAISVKGIAPAAPPEQESVETETRRLLEGGSYDRAVVGTSDAMSRQLVAAELLSALAGRNPERRERARAAFVEHGYFDEKVRDLREAQAPAERAAAARSLAITGDRAVTPHLIAALEDESPDVRRAAVEALGALRDPAAVAPLESLLERERDKRIRVPSRVIRHALETCRVAAEEAAHAAMMVPAVVEVETAEIAPAGETAEDARTAEPPVESARAEAEAHVVWIEPALKAPSVVEETGIEALASVADEVTAPEEVVAPEEVIEVTAVEAFEPAEASRAGVEPAAVEPRAEDVAAVAESSADAPQAVAGIESVADIHAVEAEEHYAEVELIEPSDVGGAARGTHEIVAAHADVSEEVVDESSVEISPVAAGEWVDFDLSVAEPEPPPTIEQASQPTAAERPASVLEPSSGEALPTEAAPPAEGARGVEHVSVASVEKEIVPGGFGESATPPVSESGAASPFAASSEKGVAPFDEFSTVPASIQQRLASREAAERAAAIAELSRVDTDEAFQQICSAFDDEAKEVRSAAARALYELRSDRAESFTRALREATPERRRHVGSAISSSGLAGEAVSQLTGESREKTYEAFSLLFLMAKAGEVQPLIRAIEVHQNSEVRLAVVKLLALSGQKEILPAFRRLAVRGSLPTEVRSAVMEAIYQISSSQPSAA
jgi:HEAT repeat protein